MVAMGSPLLKQAAIREPALAPATRVVACMTPRSCSSVTTPTSAGRAGGGGVLESVCVGGGGVLLVVGQAQAEMRLGGEAAGQPTVREQQAASRESKSKVVAFIAFKGLHRRFQAQGGASLQGRSSLGRWRAGGGPAPQCAAHQSPLPSARPHPPPRTLPPWARPSHA
jgi:hypothetical protein